MVVRPELAHHTGKAMQEMMATITALMKPTPPPRAFRFGGAMQY
jgi:hypothetical protein